MCMACVCCTAKSVADVLRALGSGCRSLRLNRVTNDE